MSAELEQLRDLILQQSDVKRVVGLVSMADGRFAYCIETPFMTFPRFVVGTTDAVNDDVHIHSRCGAEWSAMACFEKLAGNLDAPRPQLRDSDDL